MCGRFTLRSSGKAVADAFGLHSAPDLLPRYNIAPGTPVALVRISPEQNERQLALLHWGLIPFWADDPKIGYRTINSRAETVASKPSFRQAFKKRRCLVAADGFYEWQTTNGKKRPYLIHMKDDQPFAFAGLWERWKGDGNEIDSCTIVVTEANDVLKPIHDRMPVILPPEDFDVWLDPKIEDKETLQKLLKPYASKAMEAYPVKIVVNNPKNDVKECVERMENYR